MPSSGSPARSPPARPTRKPPRPCSSASAPSRPTSRPSTVSSASAPAQNYGGPCPPARNRGYRKHPWKRNHGSFGQILFISERAVVSRSGPRSARHAATRDRTGSSVYVVSTDTTAAGVTEYPGEPPIRGGPAVRSLVTGRTPGTRGARGARPGRASSIRSRSRTSGSERQRAVLPANPPNRRAPAPVARNHKPA
jgi:hypothetical protein